MKEIGDTDFDFPLIGTCGITCVGCNSVGQYGYGKFLSENQK